jgi:hypothetical protein
MPCASPVLRGLSRARALRRTFASAARRSIEVAARSTSAANVIEYSYMRARNDSTRTSGRISGQGLISGCVDCFPRLAHATREDSAARHAPARIALCRAIVANLSCSDRLYSLSSRPASLCANRNGSCRCWHPARPADLHSLLDLRRSDEIHGISWVARRVHGRAPPQSLDTAVIRSFPAGGDLHTAGGSGERRNSRSRTRDPTRNASAFGG